MRSANEILYNLEDEKVEVLLYNVNGGHGVFRKGYMKGWTISWTWDKGWEHVSIDGKTRTPTWEEMCHFKELFWDDDEVVVQYHPKKSEYVNIAPKCLHLWKPIELYSGQLVRPPKELVY